MEQYKVTANLNLKLLISETREVIKALEDFADDIERIDEKYNVEVAESEDNNADSN